MLFPASRKISLATDSFQTCNSQIFRFSKQDTDFKKFLSNTNPLTGSQKPPRDFLSHRSRNRNQKLKFSDLRVIDVFFLCYVVSLYPLVSIQSNCT